MKSEEEIRQRLKNTKFLDRCLIEKNIENPGIKEEIKLLNWVLNYRKRTKSLVLK
jgi:hypothetical protein